MIRFSGIVWRMAFEGRDALTPGPTPEGRFHHSGQWALYASLTPEGTAVAIRRYMRDDDPPRLIHPIRVDAGRVADLRGRRAASVVWQDIRRTGAPAPTWAHSDQARDDGAQAMLYSSRSRPELTHMVLFDPTIAAAATGVAPVQWTAGDTSVSGT